jgi:hypothetical protein
MPRKPRIVALPTQTANLKTQDTPEVLERDAEFMTTARRQFNEARDADRPDREQAIKDVDFVGGNQWDPATVEARTLVGMPSMTWNRSNKFCDQICNEGRKANGAIAVVAGDNGDPRTAELKADRVRQIEYESDADIAYDTAREGQVISGRGFYKITTSYAGIASWKQVIRIVPIENQFSVFIDPIAKRYDRQDAKFMFVDVEMSKDAYKREFGADTPLAKADFFSSGENPQPDWLRIGPTGDNIRVAEYWLKEFTNRTLCLMMNDTVKWKDDVQPGEHIKAEREEYDWEICQYIIDGISVLKSTKWPIKLFPIIPVWGRQEIVKGKKYNIGAGRHAHDAARLVNLYVSNISHQISMMSKTPYIGYEGQFEGHEDEWDEVNNIPKAYIQAALVYDKNGNLAALPQHNSHEPPIQGLTIGLNQSVDALKAAFGIYDASLGAQSPDASALAIEKRNTQSDTGNYHFGANEARSRKVAGKVILELIKKIDAQSDEITVRSSDGKTRRVPLRRPVKHTDGSTVSHDLTAGQDEPHVVQGPGYTSARAEAFSFYSTLAHQDPNFMQIAGDVMFRAADWPGADELADRYKKMLPPQLQNPGDPAQLQAKLQQGMQMVNQLTAKVHELQDKLDAGIPEIESRERITAMQEETKRMNISANAIVAEANLGYKAAIDQLQGQIQAIQHSMDHTQQGQSQAFDQLLDHFQNQGLDIDKAASDQNAAAPSEPEAA